MCSTENATHAAAIKPTRPQYRRRPNAYVTTSVPKSNKPDSQRPNKTHRARWSSAHGPTIGVGGANGINTRSRYSGNEPYAKNLGLSGLSGEKNSSKFAGSSSLDTTRTIWRSSG